MEHINYKYIVTVDTTAWDNSIEEAIEDKSTTRRIEFTNTDPLVARQQALDNAKSLVEYFEDDSQPHPLPPIKWGEEWTGEEPMLWMWYQIKVDFKTDNKTYNIYNTGEVGAYEDDLFEGLQKEFEILKKDGFNLREDSEIVKYYDYKDKKNKKAYILSNGMKWKDTKINIIHGINLDILEDKDKKTIKQKISKKTKKNLYKQDSKLKSTYKYRFNINKDIVEISLRTSFPTIPNDFEKSIEDLIKKWTAQK